MAPTIAALAAARTPPFVDGRSLLPLLQGDETAPWREAVLVEMRNSSPNQPDTPPVTSDLPSVPFTTVQHYSRGGERAKGVTWDRSRANLFRVLRTAELVYIEYDWTGERELYDLRTDPYQLTNLIDRASPEMQARLRQRLTDLGECAAARCRAAEDAPLETPF